MNLNFIWQFKLVGPRGDNFDNLIWSYSAVVQLVAWATSDNILCIEPYSIPFLQSWGRSPSSVCTLAITVLDEEHLSLKLFLDLL
jgi:hypothetical protein